MHANIVIVFSMHVSPFGKLLLGVWVSTMLLTKGPRKKGRFHPNLYWSYLLKAEVDFMNQSNILSLLLEKKHERWSKRNCTSYYYTHTQMRDIRGQQRMGAHVACTQPLWLFLWCSSFLPLWTKHVQPMPATKWGLKFSTQLLPDWMLTLLEQLDNS
jgi:hypothetical protein